MFLSSNVYTKRIARQIFSDVHDRLVNLCKRLEVILIIGKFVKHIFSKMVFIC